MLKTHGVGFLVYALIATGTAFTLADFGSHIAINEQESEAFHGACAMDGGTVENGFVCVVNGKAVLFK